MSEIKSALVVAQSHVRSIQTANGGYSSIGTVSSNGEQLNSVATGMRVAFLQIECLCRNLYSLINSDVEHINEMAAEFEAWDATTGK